MGGLVVRFRESPFVRPPFYYKEVLDVSVVVGCVEWCACFAHLDLSIPSLPDHLDQMIKLGREIERDVTIVNSCNANRV